MEKLIMNKFLYTYKDVELLWEVVSDHGSKGLLCKDIDGVFGGMQYFSCGVFAYFSIEHVNKLIADAEARRLRRLSSHETSELGMKYTIRHARQSSTKDQEREGAGDEVHAVLQDEAIGSV